MIRSISFGRVALAAVALLALGLAGYGVAAGQGMMGPGGMRGGPGPGGGMGGGMGRGGMGMGPNSEVGPPNPQPRTADSISRGKALFESNCAVCHGHEGLGDGPAAAGLNPRPANLRQIAGGRTDGNLFLTVISGRGVMPAFQGTLTELQRWDVVNFLRTLAP